MSAPAPTRLGPYELVASIGKGGMGEVWKARDPRLGRDVAIKISAAQFTDRFEREARAIAALNHPNICTLFDVGPNYLVMELVEGPTLAERILQGPIPLEEALGIAKQMADALEAAHEKGIIHRDLKPANIKIRPDGSVKVLDFGLAKAANEAVEYGPDSPTMLSVAGMIIGTAGYMSPEQARGKVVDKRADIWAFGVVLFEMLTGKRLFGGDSVSDTIAAVVRDEPDWTRVPVKVRGVLRSCLEKEPRQRLRDIGDFGRLLGAGEHVVTAPLQSRLRMTGWIAAAAFGLIAAYAVWNHPDTANPEIRLDIATPATKFPGAFALSPDGRKIVYEASGDGPSRLWVRSLNSISATPLPGTEGGLNPFWSPDSGSIAFFADQKLERIDPGSGAPQVITETNGPANGRRGTWGAEDVILYNPGPGMALVRIRASGGQAAASTKLGKGQNNHRAPQFLPDGRHFLFAAGGMDPAIWLSGLNGEGPPAQLVRIVTLAPGADSASEYLAPGWLVRVKQNTLIAQRFDATQGKLSGEPVTLSPRGGLNAGTLSGFFSVSNAGTIAWRGGGSGRSQLVWFNRAGQNLGIFGDAEDATVPELAPNGNRVAVIRGSPDLRDIWLQDGTRSSRLTFAAGNNRLPLWSPDGTRVVFAARRTGVSNLYQKPADGSGTEEVLLQSDDNKWPTSWSSDGRFILYGSDQNKGDLMVLPLTGDRKPFVFLSTPFNEQQGVFSPDGKWIAYQSNESGTYQIYVRPFPGPGGQWQISTAGGKSVRWKADGKELYYLALDNRLMAVAVKAQGGTVVPGTPEALFQTNIVPDTFKPEYDVARDGRFLINTQLEDASSEPIHLLMNWKPPVK